MRRARQGLPDEREGGDRRLPRVLSYGKGGSSWTEAHPAWREHRPPQASSLSFLFLSRKRQAPRAEASESKVGRPATKYRHHHGAAQAIEGTSSTHAVPTSRNHSASSKYISSRQSPGATYGSTGARSAQPCFARRARQSSAITARMTSSTHSPPRNMRPRRLPSSTYPLFARHLREASLVASAADSMRRRPSVLKA